MGRQRPAAPPVPPAIRPPRDQAPRGRTARGHGTPRSHRPRSHRPRSGRPAVRPAAISSAASASPSTARDSRPGNSRNPCGMSGYSRQRTGTPASRSAPASASPSSRNGSNPATSRCAGGGPRGSVPALGAARGSAGAVPPPYWDQYQAISSLDRNGSSALRRYDSELIEGSVAGYSRAWNVTGESPASRSSTAAAAARLAPELSPATAGGRDGTPISSPWAASHRITPTASSTAAGKGCSGARR